MKKTVCVLGIVALATTLLPGCEVTGPHVKLKPPVTVDDDYHHRKGHHDKDDHDDDDDDNDNGNFCPPGQAKKGRC
ncbi:MAG TPA: hypothetical protein VLB90_02520 [Pseudomonadales bacterium]|nr:hypothetical protein [Pseudomonadales bacterium]